MKLALIVMFSFSCVVTTAFAANDLKDGNVFFALLNIFFATAFLVLLAILIA
jgi:hypothetical protein